MKHHISKIVKNKKIKNSAILLTVLGLFVTSIGLFTTTNTPSPEVSIHSVSSYFIGKTIAASCGVWPNSGHFIGDTVCGGTCPAGSVNAGGVCRPAPVVSVSVSSPSAGQTIVAYNSAFTLSWSATNLASTCSLYKNGGLVGTYAYPGTSTYTESAGITSYNGYRVDCSNGLVGQSSTLGLDVPPVPVNLSYSCNPAGTQATVSWGLPGGYNQTYFRAYDRAVTWSCGNNFTDQWCNDGAFSSVTMNIVPGHTYDWWIHTKYSNGAWSNALAGTSFTCYAPAPVVTATVSTGRTWTYYGETPTINWTATNNPTTCTVYRSGTAVGTYNYATTKSYTTPAITSDTPYYITCTNGNTGQSSTLNLYVPAVPVNPTYSCNTAGTQATLSWGLPGGYSQSYFRAYDTSVTWTGVHNGTTQWVTDGAFSSQTITTTPGKSYTWWLHTKEASTGVWSNAIYGTTFNCPLPAPVVSLSQSSPYSGQTVVPTSQTIVLTWSATNSPTSCTVYKNGTSVGTYAYPGTTTYTESAGITSSTSYRVDCTNTTVGSSPTLTLAPPASPTALNYSCNAAGTQATLNWTLPSGYTQAYFRANDTGTPYVYPTNNGSTMWTVDTATSPTTITTVPGHSYAWWVHTRHTATGAWSYETYGTTFTCYAPCTNGANNPPTCNVCPSGYYMNTYNVCNLNQCGASPTPANYGYACTSGTNACGQSNAGTISCAGTCSGATPNSNGCVNTFKVDNSSINPNNSVSFTWNMLPLATNTTRTCGFYDRTGAATGDGTPIPGLQNLSASLNKVLINNIQRNTEFCLVCLFYNATTGANIGSSRSHQWVRVIKTIED